MTPEKQRAWLEEVRPQLELIMLNARLLGHVGSKGSGYARDALQFAEHKDYGNAQKHGKLAIKRWAKFVKNGR